MGEVHSLTQWPEILAFAWRQVLADLIFWFFLGNAKRIMENKFEQATDFFSSH
jgi:hypothetical protein